MRKANDPTHVYKQPDSVLILSEPGGGKSTLALNFPKPFVLNCDRNLAGPIRWLKENNKPTDFYYGDPFVDENDNAIPRDDWFKRAVQLLQEAVMSTDIKTIIIDSLTTFVDIVLTEVMRQQGRPRGSFEFKTSTSKTVDTPLQIQDWGAFFGLMKHIIFQLKSTDKTLVVTGHLKTDKDELSGILKQFIACPGQMSEIIAGYFSEVWLIRRSVKLVGNVKQPVREVITFPEGVQNEALGLKSSIGLKSGESLNIDEIIKRITA